MSLKKLLDLHDKSREIRLPYRRFSFELFLELLEQKCASHPTRLKEQIGTSIEGRPIYAISFGTGSTRVLLWTQMHGNESTATRAFFDFFNASVAHPEYFEKVFESLTIVFIPVLNPDGMARFQRANAIGIDPNRDARAQQTPEIKSLLTFAKNFEPDWCFNLHDQRNLFSVKGSTNPATVSFLSPSHFGNDRKNRLDAKQMVVALSNEIQTLIPNCMGRFDEEYYPRAIGEKFQEMGYRTILIEAGGAPNDPEREVARKMNFLLFCSAFHLIGSENWKKRPDRDYYAIPENDQKMVDLLIKGVTLHQNGHSIVLDIAIERVEENAPNVQGFIYKSIVKDLGDLKEYGGYEVIDAQGYYLHSALELNAAASFVLKSDSKGDLKIENGFILE